MATEVPSCNPESSVNPDEISIIKFMEKCKDKDFISNVYNEWTELLKQHQICYDIRVSMDDWFLGVLNSREEVHRMEMEELHNMMENREIMIYNSFVDQMTQKINQAPELIDKWKLKGGLDEIEKQFTGLEWVKNAIKCMEKECKLIRKYSQDTPDETTSEMERKIEEQSTNFDRLHKEIQEKRGNLETELDAYDKMTHHLEKLKKTLNDLTLVQMNKRNGLEPSTDQIQKQLALEMEALKKKIDSIGQKTDDVMKTCGNAVETMKILTTDLQSEIDIWKREFGYEYAQVAANPDLDRIAPWVVKTGRMLRDLRTLLLQIKNLFVRMQLENNWTNMGFPLEVEVMSISSDFFQSSFVVVEQEDFVIKKDKKNFPKIAVRFLGAEDLGIAGTQVKAYLVYEDHIDLKPDGMLDIDRVKANKLCTDGGAVSFQSQKKGNTKIGAFHSMHFQKDFSREDSNIMVHDQKYRFVFVTVFESHPYWTISLPVVITTGANQGCRALASVMWQCISTDPYNVPIQRRDELPWWEVAEMVNKKIMKLCSSRQLSQQNLSHLKHRLFGRPSVPDDEMVSLKRFCFDKVYKMDKDKDDEPCQFSFWKWFLANFNLLEKYLLDYWKNGLIEGFISKEDCSKNFKDNRVQKNGIFILRFSDNNITDSQGVKNVFGHLTAAVCNIVSKDGEKKKKVDQLDIAGHPLLKKKNLATILQQTKDKYLHPVYKYLFPGDRTREDTFDKFCQKEPIVDGYDGPQDAFIVDLEHMIHALCLSTGKHHRSPSLDSGFDAASPLSAYNEGNGGKRLRSVEDSFPTLSKMLSSKPVDNSLMNDSNLSVPLDSPAMSVPSPAMESRGKHMNDLLPATPVPSPECLSHFHTVETDCQSQPNIPSMVQEMPDFCSFGNQSATTVPQSVAGVCPPSSSWVQTGNSVQPNRFSPLMHGSHESSPEDQVIIEVAGGQVDPEQQCIVLNVNDITSNQQFMPSVSQSANQVLSNAGLTNQSAMQFPTYNQSGQLECQADHNMKQVIECLQAMPVEFRNFIFSQFESNNLENSQGPAPTATDNTPEDFQMNSSGSSFIINQADFNEAQQMDSGSIDPAVLQNFVEDEQTY